MKHQLTLSVVSHNHNVHIKNLLLDLAKLQRNDFRVILTLNLPEELPLDISLLPYEVMIVRNATPKGFGSNHNAAFKECHSKYFVILNPDVRFLDDPFDIIMGYLNIHPKSICAPTVINAAGVLENTARLSPTPSFLLKKLVHHLLNIQLPADSIHENSTAYFPDWIAGMFIVVAHDVFQRINGFDESYHLYYEDVDLCMRAKSIGYDAVVLKNARVIHEAQRDSHRKIKHFFWHVQSILKFFMSKSYHQLRDARLRDNLHTH